MMLFSLVKKMRNVRELFNLSISEQSLFWELIFVCNEKGWVDCFTCYNKRLSGALNISDRTFQRLRNRLVECELISCYSRKQQQQSPFYSLTIDLETKRELPTEADLLLIYGTGDTSCDTTCDMTNDMTNDMTCDINVTKMSDFNKTNTKTNTNYDKEHVIKQKFEQFRKAYPGSKRGAETEYRQFRKKHADFRQVAGLLLPAIENEIKWRSERKARGLFVPAYAHLSTWLNQRRWEVELETIKNDSNERPYIID